MCAVTGALYTLSSRPHCILRSVHSLWQTTDSASVSASDTRFCDQCVFFGGGIFNFSYVRTSAHRPSHPATVAFCLRSFIRPPTSLLCLLLVLICK
uniref:Secreted protein n=1 Tax=Pyxicephalus adspersus TaxID=30357 RepID=A0AAV3ACI2_PYXAD|nr:TPA: hypothetical protein GDO54_012990 [Pyxicephalus adspersus]